MPDDTRFGDQPHATRAGKRFFGNGRGFALPGLIWIFAVFVLATGNMEFFRQTIAVYPVSENWPFLLALSVVVLSAIVFFFCVFSLVLPVRFVAALFLIIAAGAGYFSDGMSVVVDTEMIRNILHTDVREVSDLVHWGLIWRLLVLGAIPLGLVFAVPLRPSSLVRRQLAIAVTAGTALLAIVVCVLPFGGDFASYAREHKPLRYYTNPLYPIYSAIKFSIDAGRSKVERKFVTRVASANVPADDHEHELVVVVIGETARADHFGINGYERQTTPRLSARTGVVSFADMRSCGTSTAYSVPCMFSLDSRSSFDIDSAKNTENVLDVLAKAGVSIIWRDNNSGSQGVADRLDYTSFTGPDTNPVCDDEECRDIGMLDGLDELIAAHDGDILIVLHQMGSHGPAYYKRYPDDFAEFGPDCRSNDLGACSREEIVNAYDNSIVATDQLLASVIAELGEQTDYDSAMLYLSDHGESLGE
ncbi:MAG: phosphoethanolamine--lipid A transferase, partial [Alphaproteobacteria bacterium]